MFQKIFILSIFSLLLTGCLYLSQDNLQANKTCHVKSSNEYTQMHQIFMAYNTCSDRDTKCNQDHVKAWFQNSRMPKECVSCWTDLATCTRTKCKQQCYPPNINNNQCINCSTFQCKAQMLTCSGLPGIDWK